jgi:hypothetical protein
MRDEDVFQDTHCQRRGRNSTKNGTTICIAKEALVAIIPSLGFPKPKPYPGWFGREVPVLAGSGDRSASRGTFLA